MESRTGYGIKPMRNLEKLHLLYDYIIRFKQEHDGNMPTYEEMRQHLNVSRSTVFNYLKHMESIGMLRIERISGRRSPIIYVTNGKWELKGEEVK